MKFNIFKKKKTIAEMTPQEVTEFVNAQCEQAKRLCEPDPEPMELLHPLDRQTLRDEAGHGYCY